MNSAVENRLSPARMGTPERIGDQPVVELGQVLQREPTSIVRREFLRKEPTG
jgi:hypothetical protein